MGVAVGEATVPIWRDHFKILLNQLAPSVSELEHVDRPIYAADEKLPIKSRALDCIQKMKNGKFGVSDGICVEMLKYLPSSVIRETTLTGWTKGCLTLESRYNNTSPQEVIRH
ncbi:hypothetical protein RB195_014991 [Necator americanus]|uniref:Uncharacterized protein n=1 Tax=Necator americanus TaxID=51031 RepID=A0ABR1E2H4_NECAM